MKINLIIIIKKIKIKIMLLYNMMDIVYVNILLPTACQF
jgi:hypothetical protein